MSRPVHYLPHHCGPQECDCVPICHTDGGEISVTSDRGAVTCKNCLRAIDANKKRQAVSRERTAKAIEAWADECAH